MDKRLLQDILSQAFELKKWQNCLREVFGAKSFFQRPKLIPLSNNKKAEEAYEIGSFSTSDDQIVGLYVVKLKPNVGLERNKVGLRELLRSVYKNDVDGALIVFEQQDKWRLSFVSEIRTLDKEGHIIKRVTEPKRYTYLLGKNEKIKTPLTRFASIAGKTISLEDIRNTFSVEALNKEFYELVAECFYQLIGGNIEKGKKMNRFEGVLRLPSVPKENHKVYQEFAVRLIGRTIFCWFLKVKKSNIGIPLLPEDLLSSNAVKDNNNYYHAVLEKLFFQTLNTPIEERRKHLPHSYGQVPFLNGGLFEPQMDDYYKANRVTDLSINLNTLIIPDKWFQEFFEKLEQYNFTIDENSVVDTEISVDPEMLGRIFENLLAEIDPDNGETARKATGSFYTPREIVDLMVTESMVHYLYNQTKINKEDLYPIFKLDDKVSFNRNDLEKILDALDRLKILDPACGSGAFPIGVLQKMIMALQKLDENAIWWKKRQISRINNAILRKQVAEKLQQTTVEYARKIGVIQNSLYGVDIQPIAAEISKLRCFLSLIVDENIDETKPNRGIEPLPNLEFKFVTADTLVKLPEEEDLGGLFNANEDLEQLQQIRLDYLQSYGEQKNKLRSEFQHVQDKIIKYQYSTGIADPRSRVFLISNWNPFSNEKVSWFDPLWMYGVKEFDIVIGNPPYVPLQKEGGRLAKLYANGHYKTFERTGDIYTLFYEIGYTTLAPKGILCFITSNKWMRAAYGESLRKFFAEKTNPILLIDFAGQKIFSSATVDTNIILFEKACNSQKTQGCMVKEKCIHYLGEYIHEHAVSTKFTGSESWVILSPIEQRIKEKIERVGTPLKDWDIQINYGIKTGYNEAFIIDGQKKAELIAADPKSAEIIHPILRGRDIKRYSYEFADLYLIATFPSKGYHIEKYPAVKRHLLSFGHDRLRQTGEIGARKKTNNKWFETQDSISYWEDFFRPKIVWGNLNLEAAYCIAESGIYVNAPCSMIVPANKYLLAILNSKLADYYIRNLGVTRNGGYFEYKPMFVEKLPIPQITNKNKFVELVDRLSASTTQKERIEKEINNLIYAMYKLNSEEIQLVETWSFYEV